MGYVHKATTKQTRQTNKHINTNTQTNTTSHSMNFTIDGIYDIYITIGLNFYQRSRLINFIRRKVKEDSQIKHWNHSSFQDISLNHPLFDDDQFLFPVMQDDALLYSLEDEDIEKREDETLNRAKIAEQKVSQLESVICEYRELLHQSILARERAAASPRLDKAESVDSIAEDKVGPKEEDTEPYFSSYAHYSIHETMLQVTL
jgi:type I protein arginine methyltransferase